MCMQVIFKQQCIMTDPVNYSLVSHNMSPTAYCSCSAGRLKMSLIQALSATQVCVVSGRSLCKDNFAILLVLGWATQINSFRPIW